MIREILRYIHNNGSIALVLRLIGIRKRRATMTIWQLMVTGVVQVGQRGWIPTVKSGRVAKLFKRVTKIRIFLTVPEWWGGGAVYYLNEQIRTFDKETVSLVVSPSGHGRVLAVRIYVGPDKQERILVNGLSALNRLPAGKVADVVVSTIVAWHDVVGRPEMDDRGIAELMDQILSVKKANRCKLLYLLHDYYCFCPRLFLVPYEGQYCALETDADACAQCCKDGVKDCDVIASGTDARRWREVMRKFLIEVDEIRAFCTDTVSRMKRVFPEFQYTLVPHREPHDIKRQPKLKFDSLTIGVIGNISRYKGVAEVVKLSRYLSSINSSVKIVVVGGLFMDNLPALSNVIQTGHYGQGELPDLIERYGINIVWFSSTFPETFSYVMHEIMQMNLPVVAYDRGAQCDCAKGYALGRVIPSVTPESTWDTIQNLFKEMKGCYGR